MALKPVALVTGASSGIGYELAKLFAANDFDLLVAAEDAELDGAAEVLRALGAGVESVRVDLTRPDDVEELWRRVKETGRPLAAAALNPGAGAAGAFAELDLGKQLSIVDRNVRATVHLAHHVVRDMLRRNEGRVLITSSIAATMPGSFQAVYHASKSFDQSFALALREELGGTGVTVTSLMPDGHDPADVAGAGFAALMDGTPRIPARRESRLLPDGVKVAIHRRVAEPGSVTS